MATRQTVSDPDDPRLADYRDLRRPDRRPRREGFLVAEGHTVLGRVLESDLAVRSVLVSTSRADALEELLAACPAPVYLAPPDLLGQVVGFDLHRGVVASVDRPAPVDLDALAARALTLVVLVGLNDAENLGAIARSARALGADGLVVDATTADPWSRRAVRVSMGELLLLPIAEVASGLDAVVALGDAGWTTVALTPRGQPLPTSPPPDRAVALVFGAEGPGLSDDVIAACTQAVRIPMRPDVDSLNVGHAAAVALAWLGRAG